MSLFLTAISLTEPVQEEIMPYHIMSQWQTQKLKILFKQWYDKTGR